MKIIIDSREKTPLDFSKFEECEAIVGTLDSGDYSVYGLASEIAVERKSLDDLIGCLTHDRERFTKELKRLRGYSSAMLVVEAPFDAILQGRYRSQMNPEAAAQSVLSIMQQFRLPCFFAKDRDEAAFVTYSFLRHALRHEAERAKRLGFTLNA